MTPEQHLMQAVYAAAFVAELNRPRNTSAARLEAVDDAQRAASQAVNALFRLVIRQDIPDTTCAMLGLS